jgi:tRNA dimethylallyltransferase
MATGQQKPELLVIVGPTASGKSDLALKVAKEFNGEIIAADSRTIYKGMDVGTAKPSKKDQGAVPHWGLDIVDPGQVFSAYQFKNYAKSKIEEIQKNGKLPILVGGSGMYVDAVIFDFEFVNVAGTSIRAKLESMTTEQLQELIKKQKYPMPENKNNRRHLIRTVEREGKTGTKRRIKDNTIIIGLQPPPEVLKKSICERANKYFDSGLLEETKLLLDKLSEESLKKTHGIAYAASIKLLKNEIKRDEAITMIQNQEWQYARRQRMWFRRNKFIRWFSSKEEAYKELVRILNN